MTFWNFDCFRKTFLDQSLWIFKWVNWWCHALTICHIFHTKNFKLNLRIYNIWSHKFVIWNWNISGDNISTCNDRGGSRVSHGTRYIIIILFCIGYCDILVWPLQIIQKLLKSDRFTSKFSKITITHNLW